MSILSETISVEKRVDSLIEKLQGNSLPEFQFTLNDVTSLPPEPRFLIEKFLPSDVSLLLGTGGAGKSTLLLQLFISLITRAQFLGMPVVEGGPVIYVTAEDTIPRIRYRLFHQMNQLGLLPAARKTVVQAFYIIDLTGTGTRLVRSGKDGNLEINALVDALIRKYKEKEPVLLAFDPLVRFGPGERYVNDGEDMIMQACLQLQRELDCCVLPSHHVSKEVARNGTVDHHAGRGGSALGDGARAVLQLTKEKGNEPHYFLDVTKLTDAPLPPRIMLRRDGWVFKKEELVDSEELDSLRELQHFMDLSGYRYLSRREWEELYKDIGIPRNQIRSSIIKGLGLGTLIELPLPEGQKHGAKKTYVTLRPQQG